ncbi:outer membrane protein assembly factor BamA [Mitsuaria sp. TWR114]|uniref:outer membrane protein assembly factor BamA n=1 Tax=unclassified Roseateles TaxID=2626991 RepID=UPI0011BEC0F3|nr:MULTISPECIES: outer membrane protein assembly factor BamA [unclassified Roseateles]MBB3292382.1 outer membrane protein insertion porin family [Mitsuaria sp. BK041]MBB3361599.1 outer membrane protein insertion porin family [Mitsuaria sp. BK045]TXD81013.1 outer membrane protein assembly factor BamA [Mitsuaria sp. TWR114]
MSRFLPDALRPHVIQLAVLATALHAGSAWAAEPFVLKDIRVEGLQRTDPGTVFAALPFRIGDTYNDEKGAAALRALFATGLFKDVRINLDTDAVVIVIEERPIIANVSFVGLKEFDTEALTKSLKDVGIGEGKPFDKALADRAEQELKRQYLTRSLYGAEVTTTITPIERNRVNVSFSVTEGEPAKIAEIRILGNKVFSESTLTGLLEQTTSGWLTWYTKTDRYSRAKLNADLETIRSYYLNRGYLEFNVESTQVTISPDKQSISVAITISEGQPYTVNGIKLEGDFLGREEEFKRLVALKPGQPYNGEAVAQTTRNFQDLYGTFGYAFARVESRPEIDRATGQVTVTLVGEPQRRVYVRRVLISGNTRTRDEVIRREFRQFESSWYDGARIKASRDRVERLGYFKDVTIDTTEVPGSPDQVDVTLTVTERPTGNIQIGAGYSSASKLSLSGSISQENVFGSGNYLGIQVNTASTGRSLGVTTVDPYFTVDGVSRAIDVFYRTVKPINNLGEEYEFASYGGSVKFGVPFSEDDTVFFGIGYETTRITTRTGLPNSYWLFREQFGASAMSIPLTIGWKKDNRDSVITPTAGAMKRVNLEMSPVGDSRYTIANLQYQEFFPLGRKFSLMINGEFAYGKGLGGRPYPIFKNFYGGGLGSVRVFEPGTLGPVDVTGSYTGGNRKFNLNTEFYVPVPGSGNDKSFRLFGFLDAGNVWGQDEKLNFQDVRASAGVGISWLSPMGPLRLSYGSPIRKKSTDRIERFQFQIGTAF